MKTQKLATTDRDWRAILRHPFFIRITVVLGIALVVVSGLLFSFNLTYSQRIFPKTYVAGINVGGKTPEQAKIIFRQAANAANSRELKIIFQDKTWPLKKTDLELEYDVEQSAKLAWAVGRTGGLLKIIREQWQAIFAANRHEMVYRYNKTKLQDFINNLVQTVNQPEKNASIAINDLTAQIVPETAGRRLLVDKNQQLILNHFGDLSSSLTLTLLAEKINPKVTQNQAQNALETTNKILQTEIQIKAEKKDFILKPENVVGWLDFAGDRVLIVQINQDKAKQYLEEIAKDINQPAKDAKFNMSGNRAVAFQTAQTGYELDQGQALKIITEAILKSDETIKLPVKVSKPEITASSAADLGIEEIVGQATTNFYNSPANRRHNIATGAKALHGVIVKPGEEFSTLKYISPVDAAHGYLPELVIIDNQTRPEYGGGLCQVSSTLFRAALNTGLEITDRTNHSYRVPYYEPPIGMDATIYEPRPDFKFINNMKHPVLIQSSVNNDASAITFTFYGTKDGRQVEISKPEAYDYTPPAESIYIESADLASGEIKQIDHAHAGAKADFHYKVIFGSKVLQNTTFHSEYTNWPAKFLYGPGTQIPPAE